MRSRDPPSDGRPVGAAIHATAVAISGLGLLIIGPSRSGKSRLALSLMAASTRRRPILLIGDDRILLTPGERGLVARPHPRIAGFIEHRGLGIRASPYVASAPVGGLVALGPAYAAAEMLSIDLVQNFPCLRCVACREMEAEAVLHWWRGACTTPDPKASRVGRTSVKD